MVPQSGVLTSTSLCAQKEELSPQQGLFTRKLSPMPSGTGYEAAGCAGASSRAEDRGCVAGEHPQQARPPDGPVSELADPA